MSHFITLRAKRAIFLTPRSWVENSFLPSFLLGQKCSFTPRCWVQNSFLPPFCWDSRRFLASLAMLEISRSAMKVNIDETHRGWRSCKTVLSTKNLHYWIANYELSMCVCMFASNAEEPTNKKLTNSQMLEYA